MTTHLSDFGQDCLKCHDGLDTYGKAFDHNQMTFRLEGKHASVLCVDCHKGARTAFDLRTVSQDCNSCHKQKDTHKGSLGTNCAQCHNTTDWKQATVNHNLTAFLLTGRHTTTPCASCHVNGVFKGTPKDCYSCHKSKDKHLGSMGTNCAQCHNTTDWKQATINHNLTAFPLTGRHTRVSCASCHLNGVYKGTPRDCYSCHKRDDEHRGRNGTNCARCHDTRTWDD